MRRDRHARRHPLSRFPSADEDDPLSMYPSDVLTLPANLAGLPGITSPAASEGLPVDCSCSRRIGARMSHPPGGARIRAGAGLRAAFSGERG